MSRAGRMVGDQITHLRSRPAVVEGWVVYTSLTIPTADYRYRAFLDRDQLPAAFGALAETIDYSNFKGEVGTRPTQRHKLNAYHEVLEPLYRLQE